MLKPTFPINSIVIASANVSFLMVQCLMATLVGKKVLTPKEAKEILDFCLSHHKDGPPNRAPVRAAAREGLLALLNQYDVPDPDQRH